MRATGRCGILLVSLLFMVMMLALMSLGVFFQATQGLNEGRHNTRSLQIDYACVAGLQEALSLIRADFTWSAGFTGHGLPSSPGVSYAVSVLNNSAGTTPQTAPDGTAVPPGGIFVRSTGKCQGTNNDRAMSALVIKQGSSLDGLVFDGQVDIRDNPIFDAWDSTRGDYSAANRVPFTLTTNSVASDDIRFRDTGKVMGNIRVGVGGNPSNVIRIDSSGSYTGTASAASASVPVPAYTPPFPVGTTDVNLAGSATQTLTPGAYRDLQLGGNASLSLDAGVYVFRQINLSNCSKLLVNGPVTVFLLDDLHMDGSAKLNDLGSPANFKLYSTNTSSARLGMYGTSRAYMAAAGKRLELSPYDTSEFFGSFVGLSIDTWDDCQIHYDVSIGGKDGRGTAGQWELRAIRNE
ncbi:hypothetical protein IV102_26470 [bacterium]|nr:hypothetical protein [bacterium]